jgi:AAA domain-containing protein/primase-like protein/bifunctional DNA primase/polymerase-like protein
MNVAPETLQRAQAALRAGDIDAVKCTLYAAGVPPFEVRQFIEAGVSAAAPAPAPVVAEPVVEPSMTEAAARKFTSMGAHIYVTDYGTKRCTVDQWEQKATNNLDAALRIAKSNPNGNTMLVAKQDGIWALDDDAGLVSEYEEKYGTLTTYTTRTVSGGRHFIFRQNAPSWAMGNVSVVDEQKRELLSARVDNRYVIGAGSWAHPNNDTTKPLTQYTAINPAATFEEAPQSLLDFIKAKDAEWKGKRKKTTTTTDDSISMQVSEGGRNNHLTSRAGALRNAGAGFDSILAELSRWNETECVPPLPKSEVEAIANSVAKYKEGPPPLRLSTLDAAAPVDVSDWRSQFRSVGEMDDGPIVEVIHGVLQEGICFLGASPSDGKTLVSLAMAKAISTGQPLFGLSQFVVKEPRTVIYLIPESRDRAFRKRCEAFRIPNDKEKFMARTVSLGPTLQLDDPILLQAVRDTKAVVFLDTAVRFMKGADENSAAQNRLLVNDVINLLANGAVCVVLAHHATKASPNEPMTQENMLRGTSDFAAMCDQIYGIRKDRNLYGNGEGPMELDLVNLKDREQIGELTKIRLAASQKRRGDAAPTSIINATGNFRVIDKDANHQRTVEDLLHIVKGDVLITKKELARVTGMSEYEVESKLRSTGWHRVKGGTEGASPWHQDVMSECPYGQPIITKVMPIDKQKKPTLKDAIQMLKDILAGTSESQTIPVERVLDEAGRKGITDTQVKDARRELKVKMGEDGGLYLLVKAAAPSEPSVSLEPTAA